MDPRFNDIFTSPRTRSSRSSSTPTASTTPPTSTRPAARAIATTCSRCANAFDIIVLKGEVYSTALFLSNLLRVEYRAGRLTEVAREKRRGSCATSCGRDQAVRSGSDVGRRPAPARRRRFMLHYDSWIDAYQVRDLGDARAAARARPTISRCSIRSAATGPITACRRSRTSSATSSALRRLELVVPRERRRSAVRLSDRQRRNGTTTTCATIRCRSTQQPSDHQNTVDGQLLPDRFPARPLLHELDESRRCATATAMMDARQPGRARDDNIIEMRWVLQREFAGSVVFFHKVTIPPGAIEGTHQHIGTEELYCIVEGRGSPTWATATIPANETYPLVDPRDLRPRRAASAASCRSSRAASSSPRAAASTASATTARRAAAVRRVPLPHLSRPRPRRRRGNPP